LFAYRVATAISPATYADSNSYALGTYAYKGNVLSGITSGGILEYGLDIKSATYNLPTGTPTDSIYILSQTQTYSSNRTKIALPATMSSTWSSSYNFQVDFNLTVAIASYSLAPGYIKSYVTEKDSVIGWGTMRVKTAAGTPSGYMNVLQVRTMITTLDSFYVNNAPASTTLLSGLGLTQGQVVKTYEQDFYRVNELTSLAYVQFSDSANTTPTKATTHAQRLSPNAVTNVVNDANVKVYPNPVSGRTISIEVANANGEWKYELINMTGQTIAADALHGTNNTITLPASVTPGIYYVRIMNNGKQVAVQALDVN
jgi:hypothetical protein